MGHELIHSVCKPEAGFAIDCKVCASYRLEIKVVRIVPAMGSNCQEPRRWQRPLPLEGHRHVPPT
jgi:hypothetical protein